MRRLADEKAKAGLRRLAAASLALALAMGSGCEREIEVAEPANDAEATLPVPVLDEMEPLVAEELELRRAELETLLSRGDATPVERGGAIGDMGRLYHAHRLFDLAEAFYVEAAALEPENFQWAYYLGVLQSRRGEVDEAAATFARALELRPGDVPALIRMGDLEHDRGNLDASETRYREALTLDASQAPAIYGLGRVAASRGDDDEAVVQFEKALALQPRALVIHYQLGQSYRRLGQLEQAESHLARSGNVQLAMVDPLLVDLRALTRGAGPHIAQGNNALRQGRPARAAAAYRRAVEADPENTQARQSLASILIRAGDVDGAVEQLTAVVELAPEDARAHAGLGSALSARGEYEPAIEHLRRSLALDPRQNETLFALGNALAGRGDVDEALTTYRAVLETDPDHLRARSRLGTTLSRAGNVDESLEHLRLVARQQPEDAQTHINLGVALARAGDLEAAIREHEKVFALVEAGPRLALAHFNVASFYERAGEPNNALEHYRRAVEFDPELADAHFELAELLARAQRLEEALPHYAGAGERHPNRTLAHVREAEVLMRLARFADAKGVLEKAVSEAPRDANAAHALARLLVSAPDASLRDGARGLSLAERLFDAMQTPPHTETLAMALAETGEFEEAARAQRAVLEQAKQLERAADTQRLERNLARYESGTPCCAEPADAYPPVLPDSPFAGER